MHRQVFINGDIVTCNTEDQVFQMMAVENGKIVALGTKNQGEDFAKQGFEVVDLAGKALLPGFYDAHSHIYSVAMSKMLVPMESGICSIEDCIGRLQGELETGRKGGWLIGMGFSDREVVEKRELTRIDLDRVSDRFPVAVVDRSLHMLYANSKALELLGINDLTESPEGGKIEKDPATGAPVGILREEAARQAINEIWKQQESGEGPSEAAIGAASLDYSRVGVTTTTDGGLKDMEVAEIYRQAGERGMLHTRIVVNPFFAMNVDRAEAFFQEVEVMRESDWIKKGAVKHMYDGTIQHNTAYLTKPYYKPLNGEAGYCGYASMEKSKMEADIARLHENGYSIFVHGNGDASIDDLLECFSRVIKTEEDRMRRHCIIHGQTIREDQIDRARELGVFVSLFSPHIYYLGDRHLDTFLGEERAFRLSPAASFVKRGMKFSIHCDTPVFPQNPLLAIWAAVNRQTMEGRTLGAEQCISVQQALKAYTIYAAYQNHEETERGSLEVGKYADLVLLEENPLTCDKLHIKDIKICGTYINGKPV